MKRGIRWLKVCAALGAAMLLASCASMSEQECKTADWYDQGFRDGRSGYPLSRVESHREACAKVGVVPNVPNYRAGRDRGIVEYCTVDNGLRVGRQGSSYHSNACPVELEGPFLDAYYTSKAVYDAEKRVKSLDSRIGDLERRLDREKDDKKRRRIRDDLREVERSLRSARRDFYDAERHLRRAYY